jgi:hypothetical protein
LIIYVSLHYYIRLSDFLGFFKKQNILELLDFVCFVGLVVLSYAIAAIFREVFSRFLKIEAIPLLNKWGAFVLGLLRVCLLGSLFVFMLLISSVDYLRISASDSFLGRRFFKVAPAVYSWIWNNFTSRFMVNEQFNNTVLEVQQRVNSE